MGIVECTKNRIEELCGQKGITICRLASLAGIPHTTLKSIIYNQSKNPGIVTIKKLCDGLGITVTEFFDTDAFKNLDQEIE